MSNLSQLIVLNCAIVLLASTLYLKDTEAAAAVTAPGVQPVIQQPDPLVQLGVGDRLTFEVFGQPDMSSTLYVAEDGTVRIPLVGAVSVDKLSLNQAASKIERALIDAEYLVNPNVTLTITETRSQLVSVLGEVQNPGRYVVDSGTTIFDLIALAGGLTPDGSEQINIIRRGKNGQMARHSVSLQDFSSNQVNSSLGNLTGGDSIYVPRAAQFYVIGEVINSGEFALQPGMTVLQAIALAGGVGPTGSMSRIEIRRDAGGGQYRTFKAKQTDVVKVGDVIRVKESIF